MGKLIMPAANNAPQKTGVYLAQNDKRADGGVRCVRVERNRVVIFRRVAGVNMQIGAPTQAFQGVSMSVEAAESGGAAYRLSLAHRDPDLSVVLAETEDSRQAASDWRYWALFLGLPRLAEADGEARPLEPLKKQPSLLRSGGATLSKRRPRFLVRRKTGDNARARTVFTEEREIVSYE
jgi:hypothetical protein